MVLLQNPWLSALSLLACALTPTHAAVSSFCNSGGSVCGSISVPQSGQDTFLQVVGSDSHGWSAVGIGNGMAGALIFVIYPSTAEGNVTVSPRLGVGHVEPEPERNIRVEMLPGSGIKDGKLTANFKCTNCRSWPDGSLDTSSDSQGFLWAYGGSKGQIKSSEVDQEIEKHTDKGLATLDVRSAVTTDQNPFANTTPGKSSGGGSGGGSNSKENKATRLTIAHGTIMGLAWVILLPLGAAIIRLLNGYIANAVTWHRILQITNFVLVVVGMALGIARSGVYGTHYTSFHQYFGTILVPLLLVQGALGQLHHSAFQKSGKRSAFSYAHIWFGRVLIVCGIVNCGIGLDKADASTAAIAVFSVIAFLVFAAYTAGYTLIVMKK